MASFGGRIGDGGNVMVSVNKKEGTIRFYLNDIHNEEILIDEKLKSSTLMPVVSLYSVCKTPHGKVKITY